MSIDIHKDIARRLYEEVVNLGKSELLDTFVAEGGDDTTRAHAGWSSGRAGFREHLEWLRASVPDVHATVTDILAEGDRVVVFWRIEGTHHGELFGVPPTGRRIDATSISLLTFRAGQIINYSVLPDRLTILRQVGAVAA
jgi:predicted ester cyclase